MHDQIAEALQRHLAPIIILVMQGNGVHLSQEIEILINRLAFDLDIIISDAVSEQIDRHEHYKHDEAG